MKRKPKGRRAKPGRAARKEREAADLFSVLEKPKPAAAGLVFYCDLCGSLMYERHCKLVCPTCGYTRDCSDP